MSSSLSILFVCSPLLYSCYTSFICLSVLLTDKGPCPRDYTAGLGIQYELLKVKYSSVKVSDLAEVPWFVWKLIVNIMLVRTSDKSARNNVFYLFILLKILKKN